HEELPAPAGAGGEVHVQCGPEQGRSGHGTSQPTREGDDTNSGGSRLSRRGGWDITGRRDESGGKARETMGLSPRVLPIQPIRSERNLGESDRPAVRAFVASTR